METRHILKVVMCWTLVFGSFPVGAQESEPVSSCPNAPKDCDSGLAAYPLKTEKCDKGGVYVTEWGCRADCGAYKERLQKALDHAIQTCSEAGFGSLPSCISDIKKCTYPEVYDNTGSGFLDSIRSVAPLIPGIGQVASTAIGSLQSMSSGANVKNKGTCSNYSEKDYFEEKDKLQKDIDDIQEKLSALKDKASTAAEDLSTKKSDSLTKASEAQGKLSEEKNELATQKRENEANALKGQSETSENVRGLRVAILQKRSEIATKEEAYAEKLDGMLETLAETSCMAQAKKLRTELSGLLKASMSGQSKLRSTLQATFDNCLKTFQSSRIKVSSERERTLRQSAIEVENLEEQLQESERALEASVKMQESERVSMATRENELTQQATRSISIAQQEITDAELNFQNKNTALGMEQATLTSRLNELNTRLAKLGPEPKPGAKKGWEDARLALVAYYSAFNNPPEYSTGGTTKDCKSEAKLASGIKEADLKKATENTGKKRTRK